jgi:hypothetical protein
MFNILKKIVLISFVLSFVISPIFVQAGGFVLCGGDGEPRCQLCHIFAMIDNVLDFIILKLTPVVAVLMLVIGGMMFFFAGTDPGMLEKAKKVITTTVIGLVIIFTAWIVVSTFLNYIGVMEWTELGNGGWSVIKCPGI